jgi:deoxycytidine triphosphate deaminase
VLASDQVAEEEELERKVQDSILAGQEYLESGVLAAGSALSASAIRARMASERDQLTVTPYFPGAVKGVGMDIRLGSHFIVFFRSEITGFDPLAFDSDPRRLQLEVEKGWGERFILHPNELVLASTLEYLVIPSDLTCQVVTRSSYGRLGMISATAVLVHPGFRGCLTLELVNLGEVPVALMAGERIAQLSFQMVNPPWRPIGSDKYGNCPTRPEFSRVQEDRDGATLRRMRRLRGEGGLAARL